MNDEQYFLANAYLDGELTDEERRVAEADPAVMAEVEVLRGLQAELRAVDEPTDEARDAAIGAAMAAFAERGSAAATAATAATSTSPAADPSAAAPVVPFRPRPAYARILGVAAAVVALGVLGVVLTNAGGSDDSDSADILVADEAQEESVDRAFDSDDAADTDDREPGSVTAEAADDAGADEAGDTADAADEMAEDEMSQDMSEDAMVEEEMADEMADEMAEEATADGAGVADEPVAEADADGSVMGGGPDLDPAYDTAPTERPIIDVEATITNDAELGAYGTYLLELQIDGELPPTPNTACPPAFEILDTAPVLIAGEVDDRYIAVQESEGRVLAVDRITCIALVDGPLFEPFDG